MAVKWNVISFASIKYATLLLNSWFLIISGDDINSLSVGTLLGAGSTALHYAACGGNAKCCQVCVSFKGILEMGLNECIMFSSLRGY